VIGLTIPLEAEDPIDRTDAETGIIREKKLVI